MNFMFLLLALCHVVLTLASYDELPVNPGGIGGLFRGPNSETIIKGPDGSTITAEAEPGAIRQSAGGVDPLLSLDVPIPVVEDAIHAAVPIPPAAPLPFQKDLLVDGVQQLPINAGASQLVQTDTDLPAAVAARTDQGQHGSALNEAFILDSLNLGSTTSQPVQSTLQPLSQSSLQPLSQSSLQTLSQSTLQPLSQSTLQPLPQSTLQPLSQSSLQPLSQSTLQSSLQTTLQSTLQPSLSTLHGPVNLGTQQAQVQLASSNGVIGDARAQASTTFAPIDVTTRSGLQQPPVQLPLSLADVNPSVAQQSSQQPQTQQQQEGSPEADSKQQQADAQQIEQNRQRAAELAIQRNKQISDEAAALEESRKKVDAEALERARQLAAQAAEIEDARQRALAEVDARSRALSEAAAIEESRQRAEAESIERSKQLLDVSIREEARRKEAAAAEQQLQEKSRIAAEARAKEAQEKVQAEAKAQQEQLQQTQPQPQQSQTQPQQSQPQPQQPLPQQLEAEELEQRQLKPQTQLRQAHLLGREQAIAEAIALEKERQLAAANAISSIENGAIANSERLALAGRIGLNADVNHRQIAGPITLGHVATQDNLRLLQQQQLQLQQQSIGHHQNIQQQQLAVNPAAIAGGHVIQPEIATPFVSSTVAPQAIADNSVVSDGRHLLLQQGAIPTNNGQLLAETNPLLQSELAKQGIDASRIQLTHVPLSQVHGLGRYGRHLRRQRH